MNRLALAAMAAVLAVPLFTANAQAVPRYICDPGHPDYTNHNCHNNPAPPPTERHVVFPLCVTTAWRSEWTHTPKTEIGEECQVRPGMWIPRASYRHVGFVHSRNHKHTYEIVVRVR